MTATDATLDIAALRDRLAGSLHLPGEEEYDERRRVWNGMIDRRPALIVVPASEADIQASVRFAAGAGLAVSIKGGGHNVAGHAVGEDALMLDLGDMRDVVVDPDRRVATAQGGALWGDLDRATAAYGLATTGGVIASTGVAGLTLGGGIGWLVGKHGMAIDNLREVRIATADGSLRTASETSHPDLFWALRGGGGNFGVVTSFTFALYPLTDVLAGYAAWPIAEARRVLDFYRSFTMSAPEELTCYAELSTDAESGERVIALGFCWPGDLAVGEEILAPVFGFGEPIATEHGPMPYVEWQAAFEAQFPHGRRYYWKSSLHRALPDSALDAIARLGESPPVAWATIEIEWYRGAMNRVDPAATAFAHRDAEYQIVCVGGWDDPADDEAGVAWTRAVHAAASEGALDGAFLNFSSVDGEQMSRRVLAGYGANLSRLREIKRRYDPENLFRVNNNVAP